jgi:nitroreductase
MKRLLVSLLAVFAVGGLFAQNIDLPAPHKTGGMPLMEALAKRATVRALDTKALSPQQLSDLLWAAFGINRPDGHRTAPSARNFQETDLYLLLPSGSYVYDAAQNRLNQVGAEDIRTAGGGQPAPAILIYVADLAKLGNGAIEGKKNTANIDAGYISQDVYLYCASAGLATGFRGSADRTALATKLKLREDQLIIGAQSVGYPKP